MTDTNANTTQQGLFSVVKAALGVTPNLMRTVGQSPAALEGYLSLNAALGKGILNVGLRERIALAVAQVNGCDYCLSAHTYLATNVAKLSTDEIQSARLGESSDEKITAALIFARDVVAQRGRVSDASFSAVQSAGYSEAEIVEIVLNVSLNILTNYINNVAHTEIDFPVVRA
jgi:uncharacterized peroxidase-related enzyme